MGFNMHTNILKKKIVFKKAKLRKIELSFFSSQPAPVFPIPWGKRI